MKSPATAAVLFALAACAGGAHHAAESGASPATVDLVVAATTDVHGRLRGWDYFANAPDSARGLARAATIVDSVRAANPGRVVLLDAGDLLQGNPLTYVAARVAPDQPHPVIAAMNALRYDAAAVGNHEFNYGLATLERAVSQASFPFLAANAYRADGTPAFAASRIVSRAGLKIGIVGATTPGSMLWDRDNLLGRLVIKDIVPAVREAVRDVRSKGADVVLVTVHSGLNEPSSYDTVTTGVPSENVAARIASEVPGIDLIVYGHSHREMADTLIGTTLLVQPKNWATSVAVAHLGVERGPNGWHVTSRHGTLVRAVGHAESPRILDVTARAHAVTVAYANQVIGHTAVAWRSDSARVVDTPLIDFILEVERRTAGTDLASTAAFALDASIDSGAITVAEIARLYPYDNTLRAVKISGNQLRDYLEFSSRYYRSLPSEGGPARPLVDPAIPGYNFDIVAGADYTIDLRRPIGARITRLTVKGKDVAATDSFTFALNNYRQTGGGGYAMLQGAPLVYDKQQEIRQLLVDEVQRRGTLRPEDFFTRNWSLEPPAAVGQALAAMRALPGEGGTVPSVGPSVPRPATRARPTLNRRLRIIATNDFHGAFEPRPDSAGRRLGGAAYVAAAIERARRECPAPCATLLVDAGDLFQGTPASNLAYGRTVVDLYNEMGYAATALGNHEFDWGRDTLRARMRQAHFDILGANVRYDDGRDVEWIPNDTLVERGGIKIGIIGVATTSTPQTTKASNVEGLKFADPAPVVNERARALRARGADAVIVLAHAGAFCTRGAAAACNGEIIDLARGITEPVDAIVSGHTHSLVHTVVNGIPIVQAMSSGRAVGVIDLGPGTGSDHGAASEPEVREVLADSLTPDPAVAQLVQRAVRAVAARVNDTITVIAAAMHRAGPQYALGNLIADAQRAAGHADVAVTNNGGIRADLQAGPATYGSLFEVQPFANVLYELTVTGADLRAYLERLVGREGGVNMHISGLSADYAPAKPAGQRLIRVTMADGRPLTDSARYTIVMNDFLVAGGEGKRLADHAIKAEPLNVIDLDALIGYLRAQPRPVRPPESARFIAVMQ